MSLLEKMFSTKAKRQWFPKNRLSILGSDNFINRRFFNEDDFTKTILEWLPMHDDFQKLF